MRKLILTIIITALTLGGCVQNPIKTASTEQLKQYSTSDLTEYANNLKGTRRVGPKIKNEFDRRLAEDIELLIQSATQLSDFDYFRFSHQEPTQASIIDAKYHWRCSASYAIKDARKQWFLETYPNTSEDIKARILKSKDYYTHSLIVGMTESEVIAAIGHPAQIRSKKEISNTGKLYVYGSILGHAVGADKLYYFTFSEGKLIARKN